MNVIHSSLRAEPGRKLFRSFYLTTRRVHCLAITGLAALLLVSGTGCSKSEKTKAEERKARAAAEALRTGRLLVKSNRADATVHAALIPASATDAPEVGTGSPAEPLAGLTPGKYTITVRSPGWPDTSVEASVSAGDTTEVAADFPSGSLRLDSLPTGATVRWGATVLGRTPLTVAQLPPGECALTVEYPDWAPLKLSVAITENTEAVETVRLPHGRLVLTSSPSGATVILGKRNLGKTPLTVERFQAGTRSLTLQLKDFPPLPVTVTLADQGEEKINAVMANSFPLLDAPATLQAVWYEIPASDPNRLSPNFDPFPGFHPQGSFVRNLNRKKLFETWLGRTYRFTGKIKSYNPATGQVEFAEEVSSLGKIRVAAQLLPAAREDKDTIALLATKDATLTISGRFSAMEEFERRGRPFEIEFTQAYVVP